MAAYGGLANNLHLFTYAGNATYTAYLIFNVARLLPWMVSWQSICILVIP